MKLIKCIGLLLLASQSQAVDLGSLDTSFSNDGISDGWERTGEPNYNRYGSAIVVDTQGRVYVAGTFDFDLNGNTEKGARLERYLPNGTLDASFATGGIRTFGLPPSAGNQFEYSLQLGPNDGVFMGYSRIYCQTQNECNSDIKVYHVNNAGLLLGNVTVSFDLGGTHERNDDDIQDMVYIANQNKIAIASENERGPVNDTDFGVAMINVNPNDGSLSLDTAFSGDGKAVCYFDQGTNNKEDHARSIVYNWLQDTVIVGGFVFEGNGVNGDGTNLAFCEFKVSDGSLLRKWSTQPQPDYLDEREYLSDMAYVVDSELNNGILVLTSGLLVAGTFPGDGNDTYTDFGLTKFTLGISNWDTDWSFGPNGTGIVTTGFQMLFVGETDDYVSDMILENEGSTILLAGSASWQGAFPNSATAMARFTYEGTLDTNWGIGHSGKALTPFDASNLWDTAKAIAVDARTEEIYMTGFSYDGLNFKSLIANFHNDQIFGGNFD